MRLRLSTGRDLRLAVRTSDNVQQMKRRLQTQEGVVATSQRWFFSGPTTRRQDEAGRTEDLQRLCCPGDRQPASHNPSTAAEPHSCGKRMTRWGY